MSTEPVLDARPSATMFDIESLVKLAWSGQIRVPHFQRDFRWQRSDVIRLFDSIKRGYPIGSLLLWRRPAPQQELTIGRLTIDGPETTRALFVVDGQQRITSLSNALHPSMTHDSVFGIAYDLRSDEFIATPGVEEPSVIPLPTLFDLSKVLRWFRDHPEALDQVDQANELTQTLRQFQVPAYEVVQNDVKVLQDIFDRMNNYGKRLSRAEVFSALYADDEAAKEPLKLSTIAAELDNELGFGVIDDQTITAAILARRGPDVGRNYRIEFGSPEERRQQAGTPVIEFEEDRDDAFRGGQDALRLAIRFLQDEAGVPHFTFLPYRHLLVALTRLFAHHPEVTGRNLILLRRWFWQAAATGPEIFKGGTSGANRYFNFAIKPDDLDGSIQELLRLVDRPDTAWPDLKRFRSNEAATKIVLCAWWDDKPRSLDDGDLVDQEDLAACLTDRTSALDAVRYVVPRQSLPLDQRIWAANRILLPLLKDDAKSVEGLLVSGAAAPEMGPALWKETLWSHAISTDWVPLLLSGDSGADEFLGRRHVELKSRLHKFLSLQCAWDRDDSPPLASLELEDEE